ncbi:glycosyltransferase family 2 protein [Hippea maritima]|uniref:Glycosyl transferase family 2 n=1 Tax=Hippea maritima (strain ATCC 700847 / DSM 10411 / MH2) TaxID=760142 RepID=F2LUL2_HIPMA|nr:glycosyltransferase family 2 protein [Hippea maritima]AEA34602.1 glycosyl transferase family 2 [Hippea maritima DSM 10411]
MLISVLVDNYNYAKFLPECIESVLNQTYQNFEIIIVDDGSNDNSREIIKKYTKRDNRIKPIFKENGGQASAFNEGIKHCRGELICFLDSDDLFEKDKLYEINKIYKKGYEYIVNNYIFLENKKLNKNYKPLFPYGGYNLFLVYYLTEFTGSSTSNISISKNLAKKIFPIQNESYFKIRADDVIVFASSIGSKMYFTHKTLTKYRIHGDNLFACSRKEESPSDKYLRSLNLEKIKEEYLQKFKIPSNFLTNPYNLLLELKTKQIIDKKIFNLYKKILFNKMRLTNEEREIYYRQMVEYCKHITRKTKKENIKNNG